MQYKLRIITSNDDQVADAKKKYGIDIALKNGSQVNTEFVAELNFQQVKAIMKEEWLFDIDEGPHPAPT